MLTSLPSSAAYPSPPSQQTLQTPTSSYLSHEDKKTTRPLNHPPSHPQSDLNLSSLGQNALFYQIQNFAAFCCVCKTILLTKLNSPAVLRASPEVRLVVQDLCESCQAEWSQVEQSVKMSTSIYAANRLLQEASLSSAKPRTGQPNLLHDVFFSAAPKIESFDTLDVSTPVSNVDLYSSSPPPSSPPCFSSSVTAANSPSMAIPPSPSCSSASSASYGNLEGPCKRLNTVGLGMDGVSFGIGELKAFNTSARSPPKTQNSPPLSPNVYLFDDSETLFGLDFSDACRVDAFSNDADTTTHDHYLAAVAAAGELVEGRAPKSHSESGFVSHGWLENTHHCDEPSNYFNQSADAFSPPHLGPPPVIASRIPYNTHGAMERHRMSSPRLFYPCGGDSMIGSNDHQGPSIPSPYSSTFPTSVISSNPTTVSLDAISPRIDTGRFGVPTLWNDGTLVDYTNNAKRKTNVNGKSGQEISARTSRVQLQRERRRTLDYEIPRPPSRRMTEVSDALIAFRKSSCLTNLPPVQSGRRGSHIWKRRCSGLEMATGMDYSDEGKSEDGMYTGDSADETYVASRHLVGVTDTGAEADLAGTEYVSEVETEPEQVKSSLLSHVKRAVSSGTMSFVPARSAGTVTSARRKRRIGFGQESELSSKQSFLFKSTTTNTSKSVDQSSSLSPVDDRELSPIPPIPAALVAAREAGGGDLNSPRDTLRPTVFESLTASRVDWCRYCGTTEGVNWRPGPWGKRTLCNKHGCDYKGYGFACKLPRLDLTGYAREKIDERVRPVLQLFCTTCHDPDSYVCNTLVRCEGCPRAYHRLCYDGPCTLPDDDPHDSGRQWFCSHSCSDNARRRRIVVELPRKKLPLMSTPKASDVPNLGIASRNRNGGRQ